MLVQALITELPIEVIVAALLWGASAVWSHRAAIASRSNAIHALVVLALLAGIVAPLIAYKYAVRRYSGLHALLSREPPWDQPARAPARYGLILAIAIGGVAIGATVLFGVARMGDWVIRTWW